VPRVNLPHINLGNWSLPSVPLPNLGAPGAGANFAEIILWTVVIVTSLRPPPGKSPRTWEAGQAAAPTRLAPTPPLTHPWPIDPAQVATRSQLIQAFDYESPSCGSDRTCGRGTIAPSP